MSTLDIPLTILLITYMVFISFATKKTFEWMKNRGIEEKDAIYFNRKFVHIFAGGIVTLLIPFLSTPILPLIAGIIITLITFSSHLRGGKLYWFQTNEDKNDVNFCLMWTLSIVGLWYLIQNPWIAIIPATYMAFGDGVTGLARNMLFKKRFKHPIGNCFMFAVCAPIGIILAFISGITGMTLWAMLSAAASSFLEKYEFGPIDDNILITLSSSIVLYIGFIIMLNIHI